MASGINVHEDVSLRCNEQNVGHLYKWVSYKISDDKTHIVVDEFAPAVKVEKNSEEQNYWEDFVAKTVPENEPRYFTYDFHYLLPDGGKREKLILITWVPDTCAIKKKMMYTTSKDALRTALKNVAFGAEVQANYTDDLQYEDIMKRVDKTNLID